MLAEKRKVFISLAPSEKVWQQHRAVVHHSRMLQVRKERKEKKSLRFSAIIAGAS